MTSQDAHILIVDDDERIRLLLRRFLQKSGFLVTASYDAAHARSLLAGLEFDLIVMDVMMPGEDGFSLTRDLRRKIQTPIILLTAKGETEDRINGLESGADDYLPKPFEPRELLLRIAAILRRIPPAEAIQPKYLSLGEMRFDTEKAELWQGDTHMRLTNTEQALMKRLAANLGQPVSRGELIEDLGRGGGGDESENSERAIDVQMTRLRRKIEPDPKAPRFLQTIRGAGYMLVTD